jgi:hypothetical protein
MKSILGKMGGRWGKWYRTPGKEFHFIKIHRPDDIARDVYTIRFLWWTRHFLSGIKL